MPQRGSLLDTLYPVLTTRNTRTSGRLLPNRKEGQSVAHAQSSRVSTLALFSASANNSGGRTY